MPKKDPIFAWLKNREDHYINLSDKLFACPETGLKEELSSALLAEELADSGFKVTMGAAGMPTAFIATYGSGKPVIGFLAEYDALAGCSQKKRVAFEEAVQKGAPGHACGHNLLGTGVVAAAAALKHFLKYNKIQGTIVVYGCPAEEYLVGKAYMARDGLFDQLDAALTWHPDRVNMVCDEIWQAVSILKFNFFGRASHAATEPEHGRSALDAVELMNVGANYLREHIPDQARIHYTITNGGGQPNVVPAEASSCYYIRSNRWQQLEEIKKRLIKVAEGAALMTETRVEIKHLTACPDVLPNDNLSNVIYESALELPPLKFSADDYEFAKLISATLPANHSEIIDERLIKAGYKGSNQKELLFTDLVKYQGIHLDVTGSSDVANVSWLVPTAQVLTTCGVFGTADHSWQYAAAAGSGIGHKGMLYAAAILAKSGEKLFKDPALLINAKEEHVKRTAGKAVPSLIPEDAKLPLDDF